MFSDQAHTRGDSPSKHLPLDEEARLTLSPGSLDFGKTRQEDAVIKAKEAELMLKAKQLESEMLQVRQAKVNSVLRQFEQQI